MLCQDAAVGYGPSDRVETEGGERRLVRWMGKGLRPTEEGSRGGKLLVKVVCPGFSRTRCGCHKSWVALGKLSW